MSLIWIQCSSPNQGSDQAYSIEQNDNIGEYLQVFDKTSYVSVAREVGGSKPSGLVRVPSEKNKEIEVLDIDASDAHDVYVSNKRIVYRRGKDIYFNFESQNKILKVSASHLHHFEWSDDKGVISVTDPYLNHLLYCFDEKGEIFSTHGLTGPVAASHQKWVVYQSSEGLILAEFDKCSQSPETQLVLEGYRSSHANMLHQKGNFYLAFLDESNGTLKMAKIEGEDFTYNMQHVDGSAHESYVGMDIEFFWDQEAPGLLYLDAWNLQLKLARYQNDNWHDWVLPIRGALGFYTKVLSKKDGQLNFATNSFRTQHSDGSFTYNDLLFLEIDLENYRVD